jgi:DNA-binding CsgD family transcriptional regulator
MANERHIRWLAQLQRVQDLLSQCHRLSLVVLDADCTELTVPSGLPPDCGSADPSHANTCWRLRREALSRVKSSRQAAGLPCPKGRICFLSPLGVAMDDFETPVETFLAGSGPPHAAEPVRLVQEIFRLITPPVPQPEVPAELALLHQPPSPRAAGNLTKREREILALIGAGLSNRQIAERLYLSQATVKTHITHLLQKLGLANRTEAALYAVRESAAVPRGE